jgi:signal transduction histidine kinase
MKKHSCATQVVLKFSKENDTYQVFYSDNGIGLSEDFVEKNGFRNMKTRLGEIGAKMKIEGSNTGLKVSIEWRKFHFRSQIKIINCKKTFQICSVKY